MAYKRKGRTYHHAATFIDLTGKTFGERLVLRMAGKSKLGMPLWTCQCSCGKIDDVDGAALRRGEANKCSRAHMVGRRSGKLVVTAFSHVGEKGNSYWTCMCDCGNTTTVIQSCLKGSLRPTQSCGCRRKEPSRLTHGESKSIFNNTKGTARYHLLCGARDRTKRHNLPPCDLTLDDIYVPDHCPILNIPMSKADGQCTGNSPTLDKIIPALGYVKGNVWVISFRANTMKSDATTEEIGLLYKAMKKRDKMIEEASRVRLNSLFIPAG